MPAPRPHGAPIRGLDSTPRSQSFEGAFGRMFRTLPPAVFKEADLQALALAMIADHEAVQTPEDKIDDEENQGIDAGYTYLGQFIDHDLTFDPASSLQKKNDPNGLVDFRTPRFDLDNVYGRGPDDQPYMYEPDGVKLMLGRPLMGSLSDPNAKDLARNAGIPARAVIGDPRNDENVIVSQLQASMIRFHNRMVDFIREGEHDVSFTDVQQEVRWHYQWVVLNDFLPTIVGQQTVWDILPHLQNGTSIFKTKPVLRFYHTKNAAFMPVEFSVAAYRFGHSMVRPIYRLNQTAPRLDIFSNNPETSLTGFRAFNDQWAIDWNLFFDPDHTAPTTGSTRIQKSYKIDTSLVNPLGKLPGTIANQMPSLAERNLVRGLRLGLPSGQSVAQQMGYTPLTDDELKIGKANSDGFSDNMSITDISPRFSNNAPLWFYVLAEALHNVTKQAEAIIDPDPEIQKAKRNALPVTLGDVGGHIVAEVFIGLMLADSHSFLAQNPSWKPALANNDGKFRMKELLMEAAKV